MIFRTSDVSICNGNIKHPIGASTFYTKFYVQDLHVSVVVANNGSLFCNQKLVKFEQNISDDSNYTKFRATCQKVVYQVSHF